MEKIETKKGYVAYKVIAEEMFSIYFGNMCDFCGTIKETGYYIPVLNCFYCEDCFKAWESRGKYYSEDIHIEKRNAEKFEFLIHRMRRG